jgi:hypothetical protein
MINNCYFLDTSFITALDISRKECRAENPYMRNVSTRVVSHAYLIFTRCLLINETDQSHQKFIKKGTRK